MNNPIASAIKQICDEKGIPQESVIEALEAALAAAYRKDFGEKNQNIRVVFDVKTGESHVFDVKEVVRDYTEEEMAAQAEAHATHAEETRQEGARPMPRHEENGIEEESEEEKRFNPKTDIMVTDARQLKEDAAIGEEITTELRVPESYGRMAAQTAKQVIIQKIREAERELIFEDFKDKEDMILMGTVQRREGNRILVDLGKATGSMPLSETVHRERYNPGDRIKVYVVEVSMTNRGPEIIVSRSHPNMVKKVFEFEIPELGTGAIEIKGVSRDAGERSKVSVVAHQENIDPIGSCIGQRGSRIQTIIAELGGEKVDVIEYDEDASAYIVNALSPAKIDSVELHEASRTARVHVPEEQYSLAIGRGGQNVRLASQLTGWNIEVVLEKAETPEEEPVHGDLPEVSTSEEESEVAFEVVPEAEEPSTESPSEESPSEQDDSVAAAQESAEAASEPEEAHIEAKEEAQ